MTDQELTRKVKELALNRGAGLVGVVKVEDLPEHRENIHYILSDADSVVVVVAKHSLGAIASKNNQVAQFDTIHTYDACANATHETSRFLESQGFLSVAVPAFIPIDMGPPKFGMRGEICWRRAGVRAGLGSYGENGLLVTREFGSATRISGLVTSAKLLPDAPLAEDICDHCMKCVESCPTGALSGNGKINKKLCGDEIFKFGFRFFRKVMKDISEKKPGELEAIFNGQGLIEMWQTFMTGNYYYCFKCQCRCPAALMPTM